MSLSIVMYHYVRDLACSRYPGIKGRDLAEFRRQLDYIARHHTVVTAEQVIEAVKGGEKLPLNALWLTFDDGYLDHYLTVFPLLDERGWQGTFFPPARPCRDHALLDVNKVHFILASCPDVVSLVDDVRTFVDDRQGVDGVKPFATYWTELAHGSRLDQAEVIFVKRMMQHALPEDLRAELADGLFARFVSVDQANFARELYMSEDHLRTMIRAGQHVGSHGAGHYWLDRLSAADLASDIDNSLEFLAGLGAPVDEWVMCYPYGAHDATVRQVIGARGCKVGLTTEVRIAELERDAPLRLPRLDTNDLPH